MELTEAQIDALQEILNIAFSRTAASLSELTSQRVVLDVPQIKVLPITQLEDALSGISQEQVASVHQIFTGAVAGSALLLFTEDAARTLVDLLTNDPTPPGHLDLTSGDVLTEVGNVLLNACLGMFANILHVHVTFSVPHLHVEALHSLLDSLTIDMNPLRYVLIAGTHFRLRDSVVEGYLAIILGIASLDVLLQATERLAVE